MLLGISQLKTGDAPSAAAPLSMPRSSAVWVHRPGSGWNLCRPSRQRTPKTEGIVGVCHGAGDKQVAADEFSASGRKPGKTRIAHRFASGASGSDEDRTAAEILLPGVPGPLAQLATEANSLARAMGVSLVKAGGSVDGALQIIAVGEGKGILQLGFPTAVPRVVASTKPWSPPRSNAPT